MPSWHHQNHGIDELLCFDTILTIQSTAANGRDYGLSPTSAKNSGSLNSIIHRVNSFSHVFV